MTEEQGPPAPAPATTAAAELAVLFPAREVKIGEGKSAVAIAVRPMLVKHVRRFAEPIGAAIEKLVADGVDFNKLAESWPLLLKHLAPLLLNDLFDLLNECVDVELGEVPHWVLPDVAGAWIEENFGSEDRLRPWFAVVSELLEKLGDEKVDLWASVSSALSRPDTTAKT